MAQEADDQAVSWDVELLRLTGFTKSDVDVEAWYFNVVGAPPEGESKNRLAGIAEAQGHLSGSDGAGDVLRLRQSQGRVDWLLTPVDEDESIGWRVLGNLELTLSEFTALFREWLVSVDAEFERLALGVIARRMANSREDGYRKLSEYLPFELDPSSSDFLYRINRPRTSKVLDDGTLVNRLQTWSVASFQVVRFALGQGQSVEVTKPEMVDYSCKLEMDISTSADRQEALPKGKRVELLEEFAQVALEIAKDGDRP